MNTRDEYIDQLAKNLETIKLAFAKQEQTIKDLREQLAQCKWCPGVPVNELGNHIIKGYYGSGDAALPCARFAVKERDELRSQLAEAQTHIKNAVDIGRGLRDAELGFIVPFEIVESGQPFTYIRKSDLTAIKQERDKALSDLQEARKLNAAHEKVLDALNVSGINQSVREAVMQMRLDHALSELAEARKDIGHMLDGGTAGCDECRLIETRHREAIHAARRLPSDALASSIEEFK